MTTERILLVALAALALWPLARLLRRSRLSAPGRAISLAGLAASVIGGVLLIGKPEIHPIAAEPDHPVAELSQGFTSSKTCRSCHPTQYESWHHSYHRTMTTEPTAETVKGDFNDKLVNIEGASYRLTTSGDEFLVEMDDPHAPSGVAPARVSKPVRLITGSHHMQVYWYPTGDSRVLGLTPIAYLIDDGRWVPESATYLGNRAPHAKRSAGEWNLLCIQCHTTFGQPTRVSGIEMYTRVAEFGISCEACHGPCEAHVRANGSPLQRYGQRVGDTPDSSVVHPERLDDSRRSQVCGQCHSINTQSTTPLLEQYLREGYTFRAGDEMEPERFVVRKSSADYLAAIEKSQPTFFRDRYWSDGAVRVTGREYNGLLDSPCHQHGDSDRKMSCMSCHSMHKGADDPRPFKEWADDQLKPGMRGDAACVQCHSQFSKNLEAHTHHASASEGSRCYNCHMPKTTYGLLKTISSHTVSSPSVQESLATGRPNACNLCHLDKTLKWTANALNDWHDIPKPELNADQTNIAAAVDWLLRGDAGQRAIVADAMGWEPAKAASGTSWMGLHLAQTLLDPYAAVRYIAARSLSRLPEFKDWKYDYVGTQMDRAIAAKKAQSIWSRQFSGQRAGAGNEAAASATLIDSAGRVNEAAFRRLIGERDESVMNLAE